MCGIQKNGMDELTGKAEMKIQRQRTNLWIPGREQKEQKDGMNWEIGINIYTLLYVNNIYMLVITY